MKNLLQQLKPEILNLIQESIEESSKQYTSIARELEIELQNLYYVSDIRYVTFVYLSGYYLSAFNKLPKDAWEIFNN